MLEGASYKMSNFDHVNTRAALNDQAVLDDRQAMIAALEPEYKVPLSWADGPVRNAYRKITDKCCLVIFVLTLLAMIGTAIFAFTHASSSSIIPGVIRPVRDARGKVKVRITVPTQNGWKGIALSAGARQELFISTDLTKEEIEKALVKAGAMVQ